ncbi:MAG: hypothetical protein [Olavius algarvensis Gamma 3 endosymbiont]|nr:MAG: hypothetical protein [Olavius algarvensis Gamma 3 endosymbiont]
MSDLPHYYPGYRLYPEKLNFSISGGSMLIMCLQPIPEST